VVILAPAILTASNDHVKRLKRKSIFLLYRVLLAVAFPFLLVYLLFRGVRNRRYFGTIGERFGALPSSWQQTLSASIWLHAVSVGEVLAAVPLLEEMGRRSPGVPVFVSTATLAGRETAEKRLGGLVAGVFYAPLDYVWMVRRVLRRIRPSVLVILETEIWPNLFREAKKRGCGLILVNGRISDRALPRYQGWEWLFREVLDHCDKILVQSEEMRGRFAATRVEVAGNLKYDSTPAPLAAESPVRAFLGKAPVWIAASTSADDRLEEETLVIAAQKQLRGWRLILAPRKPERFERVACLLAASGLNWTRRTALSNPASDVLLLDSIGELSGLFEYADVVFMGGTLADRGGHNILEPAIYGKPVIVGPHLENFRDIEEHFEREQAMLRIDSGEQRAEAVLRADVDLGERGRRAAEAERGAAGRTADAVLGLYNSTYPSERRAQPTFAFLSLWAFIWKHASARDRRKKAARAMKLPVPVVSVGNITTGGTGKTPITIELLKAFRWRHVGMLTRGHGRTSSENVVFRPGDELPPSITGDEPQLCMRRARAPIGIGSDRYTAGMELLQHVDAGMLVLDDGFQHLQLKRDFDLVLIDALRPFGGGHLLPLGRLREPLDGLARAHAFVVTRSDEAPNVSAIESVLRQWNPAAPVFRARTIPVRWHGDGNYNGGRAVAFCGLGNPQAFWKTLRGMGIEPAACYDFGDHHKYSPVELRRIARHARDVGANVLLTTAKDAVNLEPDYQSILGDVKLFWLEIRTEIERAQELFDLIQEKTS
jgi:3-deoxy-D-manno-octulosonic-acid transferase